MNMSNDNFGLVRVAAASPVVTLANPAKNAERIAALAAKAQKKYHPSVIVFPELSVTGYTCEDLFFQKTLLEESERAVSNLLKKSRSLESVLIVGAPIPHFGRLFNCAIVLRSGEILGIVPKSYIPSSGEFYEKRHFESGPRSGLSNLRYAGEDCIFGTQQIFRLSDILFGVEICQDVWVPVPPCTAAAINGAQLIFNLSASNELAGKERTRRNLLSATSARLHTGYVYCCSGFGESTDDLVWSGSSLIYENGNLLAESPRFRRSDDILVADIDTDALNRSRLSDTTFKIEKQEPIAVADCGAAVETDFTLSLYRTIDPHPFVPSEEKALSERCEEVFELQSIGLESRLNSIRCQKVVLGVSGGLDSTLALLVCAHAFDNLGLPRENILAVSMPCFGTSERTKGNAADLMEELGVSHREIDISEAVNLHFKDIGLDPSKLGAAYENSQARERTQVLMDLANLHGAIVVGTGDLSELALGWCTYNGDHMSMYGVNASVPKTLVREIVLWKSKSLPKKLQSTLKDICATPISPELIPLSQNTEEIIGPYELHDFFLAHFKDGESPKKILFYAEHAFASSYDSETILRYLKIFIKRFFSQQFKRSCLPNGPKATPAALSPRGDWRMSTDSDATIWLEELS